MSPTAPTERRWFVFTSNKLEQTTLVRLLAGIGLEVASSGGLDQRALGLARRQAGAVAIVAGLGLRDLADGRARRLFETFPSEPMILFFRDHATVPEDLELPPNVIGALGSDASEDIAARALSLIRMGYGVLAQGRMRPHLRLEALDTPAAGASDLTRREREVAFWVIRGESNKGVARRLGVSANTVNAHVGALLRKLGARNRTELAVRLAEVGGGAPRPPPAPPLAPSPASSPASSPAPPQPPAPPAH